MSKLDERDWSDGSAALFREARSDHDATAADRVRVHAAVVNRLADEAAAASMGGTTGTSPAAEKAAQSVPVGNIAKLALGIAIVIAGSFAITRAFDSSAPEPPAAPLAAPRTVQHPAPPDPAPATQPSAPTPRAVRSRTEPVSEQAPAVTPRALRAHTAPAKRTTPQIAVAVSAEPLSPRSQPSLEEPIERSIVQPQPQLQSQPRSSALPADDSIDARAELSLVERIHAALRNAKPAAVLALCVEHELRWPRGTFVQEREGARAIASCDARSAQAQSLARAFLAKNPNAPLAPRVTEACAPVLTPRPERR